MKRASLSSFRYAAVVSAMSAALWIFAGASSASAEDTTPRPLAQTSDFWRELRQPGFRRSRQLLMHGLRMLRDAVREEMPFRRAALVGNAIARFELARELVPDDAELLFFHARALALFERPVPGTSRTERRDHDAIAVFERLRSISSEHRAEEVGFELGILYTRTRDFPKAIEAYEFSIAHSLSNDHTPTAFSNMAEVRMMTGDLSKAVGDYERAVHLARSNGAADGLSLTLALFGMAVALDRLGEPVAAVERAAEALSAAGGNLDVLRSPNVFFEPAAEIHWYEGLGHLAGAESADPGERSVHLRRALDSWDHYLRLALEDDPWVELAARRRQELREALERVR